MSRQSLIRWVLGVSFLVPVIVEAPTFYSLIKNAFRGNSASRETVRQPADPGVRVGDPLLVESPPRETLTGALVRALRNEWVLTLRVEVENSTPDEYVFRLGDLTLADGTVINGGGEHRFRPNEVQTVKGWWKIPPGSTPDRVQVFGRRISGDTPADSSTYRDSVRLGKIRTSGG